VSNSAVRTYRDLLVWQKAIDLVTEVYALTRRLPKSEIFGLSDQMRRAAVSVPSNVAEGQARQHTREFRQFLHIALGSLAELDTQLVIAHRLKYLTSQDVAKLTESVTELRRMTAGLLSKLPATDR